MKKFLLLFTLFISRSLLSADASDLKGLEDKVIALANEYKPSLAKSILSIKIVTRTEGNSLFSAIYKAEFNQPEPQPGEFDFVSAHSRAPKPTPMAYRENQLCSFSFKPHDATEMLELLRCLHHQREQIGSAQKQE